MPCDLCQDPARCDKAGVCQRFRQELPACPTEAQTKALERVALPAMPLPVVMHPKLGNLYDRFAMHSYAMRFLMDCEKAAAAVPACPPCPDKAHTDGVAQVEAPSKGCKSARDCEDTGYCTAEGICMRASPPDGVQAGSCTYPECACVPNGDVGCNSPNAAARGLSGGPQA